MISRFKKLFLQIIKFSRLRGALLNMPTAFLSVQEWVNNNKDIEGTDFIPLFKGECITEVPPVVIGIPVSKRFTKFYNRTTNDSFVACIPNGKVLGEDCNMLITPDNKVLSDVSREFGADGGRQARDFSVLTTRIRMPLLTKLSGNIAVISTCGGSNFHHWNFDVLPRFYLLKQAGLFDKVDFFLLNYKQLPFQKEGLLKMGIDETKIINSYGKKDFYITAEKLYVPSLTEELGTITPWVIDFLRNTFLDTNISIAGPIKKLYVSRKTVSTRKILNKSEVIEELKSREYIEFIPENYSMSLGANYFARATSIVSVHGSGLSNLPFISEGSKVLDIMAPYHQDPYYWMISNHRRSKYVALFAEGEHPSDESDLVKNKVDNDLLIDMQKFKQALDCVS